MKMKIGVDYVKKTKIQFVQIKNAILKKINIYILVMKYSLYFFEKV